MAQVQTTRTPILDAARAAQDTRTLAQRMLALQKCFEAEIERQGFETRTREVVRYCRPDLEEYLDETANLGQKRTGYMYTSKPLTDLERAADAWCGNVLTPHGWFAPQLPEPWANKLDFVQKWLQDCKDHLYGIYGASNFYDTVPPVAMDSMSIGDGFMYVGNELTEGLPFFEYNEALRLWWKRNRFGRLMTVHERRTMTALEAYDRFKAALNDETRSKAITNPTYRVTFLHGVYRRDDPVLEGLTLRRPRPFVEIWIQEGAKENDGRSNPAYEGALDILGGVIEQNGYFTMPYVDWPYWLKSGQMAGRGPLGSAISSVKRLHAEHKQMMVAGQRSAAPMLWAIESLRGQIDFTHDGVTYVKDQLAQQTPIAQVGNHPRYPFGIDQLDRTEKELEEVLQLQFFLMMSLATKEMTVPEVMERVGERAAALAPRLGLFKRLFLDATHDRVWQIERMANRLPPVPWQLLEMRRDRLISGQVQMQYKGPLSMAHEQVFTQRRTLGMVTLLDPFAKLDPQAVAAKIDTMQAVEHILDESDFYQDSIRTTPQALEYLAQQNALAVEQANADVVKTGTEAVKNVAMMRQQEGMRR